MLSGIENVYIENKVKLLRNTVECVAKVTILKVLSNILCDNECFS